MNYLKYIELAAENLQFFLWYRSYAKRFSELPEKEKVLSPVWIEDHDAEAPSRPKRINTEAAAIFQGTDFANDPKSPDGTDEGSKSNPFFTPPHTPNSDTKRDGAESLDSYDPSMTSTARTDHGKRASGAFESAGLKWKPCKFNWYTYIFGLLFANNHRQYPSSPIARRSVASFQSTLPMAAAVS